MKGYRIHIGAIEDTRTGVERGIDVDVVINGHKGQVTLLPAEDGSGEYTSWGSPDHWVSGELLAYIYTRRESERVLRHLAELAGAAARQYVERV